jgi:hypothetical protein
MGRIHNDINSISKIRFLVSLTLLTYTGGLLLAPYAQAGEPHYRVTLLGFHEGGAEEGEVIQSLLDDLEKELSVRPGAEPIGVRTSTTWINEHPDVFFESAQTLRARIDQIQEDYFQARIGQSQRAINRLLKDAQLLKVPINDFDIDAAYLLQGLILNGVGRRSEALQSFHHALRMNPDLHMTENDYSPRDIQLFEKARAQLAKQGTGTLLLKSEPKGRVFVDGVDQGKGPVALSLAAGPHFVFVKRKGYVVQKKIVTIRADERQEENFALKQKRETSQTTVLSLQEKRESAWFVQGGTVLARGVGADLAVWVTAKKENKSWKIDMHAVDAWAEEAQEPRSMYAVRLPEEGAGAADLLSSWIQESLALVKAPAGQTMWAQKQAKRPLYKKPLFWVLTGIAAAGAGAGIGFALNGSSSPDTNADLSGPLPGAP